MTTVSPPSQFNRPTGVRYFVLVWFCSAAVMAYVHRVAIGVASDQIATEFSLSKSQMGWLLAAFFWGYAGFQLPSGWLGQKWGTRFGLSVFSAAWSAATAWTGLATGFAPILAARITSGVAQAGLFPACANSISKWFPERERGLPNGFLGSAMAVGSVAASALTGWLIDADAVGWSWRSVFLLYAIPGFLWTMVFYWWFRDTPEEHPSVNDEELRVIRGEVRRNPSEEGSTEQAAQTHEPTPWLAILSSPGMQLICGQQFFRAAGNIFFVSWFPEYLKRMFDVSTEQSGYLASLPLLGAVLGGMVGGGIADWIQTKTGSRRLSRQLLGAASQYLCALCLFLAYYIPSAVPAVLVISLGTFLFAFGSCAAYTVTIDMAGNHVAIVFSVMNMSGNIGAALSPILIGYLVDEHVVAMPWQYVLFVFAGIFFSAGLCWTFLNPNGTIFDRSSDEKTGE